MPTPAEVKELVELPSKLTPKTDDEMRQAIELTAQVAKALMTWGLATAEQAEGWLREEVSGMVRRTAALAASNAVPAPTQQADVPLTDMAIDVAAQAAETYVSKAMGPGMAILKAPGELAMALMPDYYEKDPGSVAILKNPIGTAINAAKVAAKGMVAEGPEALGKMLGIIKPRTMSPAEQKQYDAMTKSGTTSDGIKKLAAETAKAKAREAGLPETVSKPDSDGYYRGVNLEEWQKQSNRELSLRNRKK